MTKAADLMGLKVYEASPPEVTELAKKLPLGRLYANGRGFVPNIRQSLYSDLVVALGLEPQAALSKNGDNDSLPPARGLPSSWDDIAAGHLVIAQGPLNTGGGRRLCLPATATRSPCSTAITRTSPSSSGTAAALP